MMPAPAAGMVEMGAPAFVVLGPEAMGLSSAPTDLHRLPDGRILAVSQRELAFGDGVRWEVFRAAEGQAPVVSQVAVDTDGTIYVGVEGGIARIDFAADARWRTTLIVDLPRENQFRSSNMTLVASAAGQWHWYGNGGIVQWRPGQPMRAISETLAIDRIFAIGENVFISDVSSGEIAQLIPGESPRKVRGVSGTAEAVSSATPFSPTATLVGSTAAGLRLFDGKEFHPFGTSRLGEGYRISDVCATPGGFFAAALDGFGIVFFDWEGRAVQVLDRSLDHRLGRPRRMFATEDGVVWVILNDGVVRVDFPSPISYFDPLLASGLNYAKPVRHQGRLWVHADGRVMRGVYNSGGRLERFEEETPPGRYLFTLTDVEGTLFASNENGLYAHGPSGWTLAVPGVVNARFSSLPAGERGWPYIARGEYGFVQHTPAGFIARRIPAPELGDNYNAVADAAGTVWIELGTGRAARLDPRSEPPTLRIFGEADGLTQGWVEIYALDGVARIHLSRSLWRFDESSGKLVEDKNLVARFPTLSSAGGRPIMDPQRRLWHSVSGVARLLEPDATGKYAERKIPVNFGPLEYTAQDDGVMWLFANRRLARVDLRVPQPVPQPLRARITSVHHTASNRRIFNPAASLGALDYADNSLVVHFTAASNPFSKPVNFEMLLEGAGTQWVSTGTAGSATFNRLHEGTYVLRVRPVAGANEVGAEARLAFDVLPPWYRSRLAWISYVLLVGALFSFAAWLSAFLQRREKARLELLVAERTDALKATNRQLSHQISETTKKSIALSASEERYRKLNAELEDRVIQRTAELSISNLELQQRESLFRLMFEHAPVGISWKRSDLGTTYHVNQTFRRILDLPHDKLSEAAPFTARVHPDDRARQAELAQLVETGEQDSYNIETRFVLNDGRVLWGSLSVAVVRDDRGGIVQEIGILENITARKEAEAELAKTYKNLVDASRVAGMAEVATGVLHNVGNVLNSLNVSSNSITSSLHRSRIENLAKLSALVNENIDRLGDFLAHDPKGQLVPGYLATLAQHIVKERDWLLQEVASMQTNIDHIKEIVAMQQGYAKAAGVVELLPGPTLFEDALRMSSGTLADGEVTIVREFSSLPPVAVEKGKVLQILVNLIRNAKHACEDAGGIPAKTITLRIEAAGTDRVRFQVQDTGIGIGAENLTRIFAHGFTTRRYGHGFGLHSSALAAKEMQGSLTAQSEGPGKGATFTLELPVSPDGAAREFPSGRTRGEPARLPAPGARRGAAPVLTSAGS